MKKAIFVLLAGISFTACQQNEAPKETSDELKKDSTSAETTVLKEEKEPTLTLLWETDTILTTNESVLYDKEGDRLFVSNIEGDPKEKDGRGFISILNTDGSVQELKWATGLDAPKGMGIRNGILYVTNIDELVEIDLATGAIKKRHKVRGATFLNDVAIGPGKVYFSDTRKGKLHVLEGGDVKEEMTQIKDLNGVYFDGKDLFGLDAVGLRHYPLNADPVETLNSEVTGGDGLVKIDDHTWLASRWEGQVFIIQDGVATKLLDSKAEGLQTADIGYIPEQKLVLIPRFFGNKVSAYKLSY